MELKNKMEIVALHEQMKHRNIVRLLMRYGKFMIAKVERISKENGFEDFKPHYMAFIGNIGIDGTTPSDLARCIWVSKQAMSKTLKEMEAKGYISIEPNLKDRRATILRLGDRGVHLLELSSTISEQIKEEIWNLIGEESMEQLTQTLQVLMANAELEMETLRGNE